MRITRSWFALTLNLVACLHAIASRTAGMQINHIYQHGGTLEADTSLPHMKSWLRHAARSFFLNNDSASSLKQWQANRHTVQSTEGHDGTPPVPAASGSNYELQASLVILFMMMLSFALKAWYDFAQRRPNHNGTFHCLACVCAISMATTHYASMEGFAAPGFVPWAYLGRLVTSACLVISSGTVNGRPMPEICLPLVLAVVGWTALGVVVNKSTEPSIARELGVLGVAAGLGAMHILFRHVENSSIEVHKHGRKIVLDLILFCNAAYLVIWVMQLMDKNFNFVAVLEGFIDVAYAWGSNAMLLKRKTLLDEVCLARTQATSGDEVSVEEQAAPLSPVVSGDATAFC